MLLVLVKSSEDPLEDPFLQAVQSAFPSIRAVVISPHEFRPHRESPSAWPNTTGDVWDAVLFTSKRAVQFFSDRLPPLTGGRRPSDLAAICYAVGPATAEAAAGLAGFPDVRGGADCGNADALCDLVVADLHSAASRRILYPCGRVRRGTVEARLSGELGFQLTALEVYNAVEKDSLADELNSAVSSLEPPSSESGKRSLAIAFFSPSSASMVLSHLNRDDFDLKFISIGPSTSQRLEELLAGSTRCVQCATPTVEGFLSAVTLCL